MKYLYLCHKGNGLKPDQALMKSISRGDKDNQSQNNKSFKSDLQFFQSIIAIKRKHATYGNQKLQHSTT